MCLGLQLGRMIYVQLYVGALNLIFIFSIMQIICFFALSLKFKYMISSPALVYDKIHDV